MNVSSKKTSIELYILFNSAFNPHLHRILKRSLYRRIEQIKTRMNDKELSLIRK